MSYRTIAVISATFISALASAQTDALSDLYNVIDTGGRPSGYLSIGGGVNVSSEAVGTWVPNDGESLVMAFYWAGNASNDATALTPLQSSKDCRAYQISENGKICGSGAKTISSNDVERPVTWATSGSSPAERVPTGINSGRLYDINSYGDSVGDGEASGSSVSKPIYYDAQANTSAVLSLTTTYGDADSGTASSVQERDGTSRGIIVGSVTFGTGGSAYSLPVYWAYDTGQSEYDDPVILPGFGTSTLMKGRCTSVNAVGIVSGTRTDATGGFVWKSGWGSVGFADCFTSMVWLNEIEASIGGFYQNDMITVGYSGTTPYDWRYNSGTNSFQRDLNGLLAPWDPTVSSVYKLSRCDDTATGPIQPKYLATDGTDLFVMVPGTDGFGAAASAQTLVAGTMSGTFDSGLCLYFDGSTLPYTYTQPSGPLLNPYPSQVTYTGTIADSPSEITFRASLRFTNNDNYEVKVSVWNYTTSAWTSTTATLDCNVKTIDVRVTSNASQFRRSSDGQVKGLVQLRCLSTGVTTFSWNLDQARWLYKT